MKTAAIICACLFLMCFAILKYMERGKPKKKRRNPSSSTPLQISITLEKAADYDYSIKGINYCGLDDTMLGNFTGYARALKANKHDPFAIGVYYGNRRIGYLPGGNQQLHSKIMDLGGVVDLDGYIAKAKDESRYFYYGEVKLLGM